MDRFSRRALGLHLEDQEKQTLLSVSSCSSLFCFPLLYLFLQAKYFMFSLLKDINIERYFRKIVVKVVNAKLY